MLRDPAVCAMSGQNFVDFFCSAVLISHNLFDLINYVITDILFLSSVVMASLYPLNLVGDGYKSLSRACTKKRKPQKKKTFPFIINPCVSPFSENHLFREKRSGDRDTVIIGMIQM